LSADESKALDLLAKLEAVSKVAPKKFIEKRSILYFVNYEKGNKIQEKKAQSGHVQAL